MSAPPCPNRLLLLQSYFGDKFTSMYINIYIYQSMRQLRALAECARELPPSHPPPSAGPESPSPYGCSFPLPASVRHRPTPASHGLEPLLTVYFAGSSSSAAPPRKTSSTP